MYRNRWRIEGMFQRLEAALHSELRSLGAPRAALLAFTVAVAAYNVLALVQRAVAVAHPPEETGFELSFYYVANELRAHYPGMMIALPPEAWRNTPSLRPRNSPGGSRNRAPRTAAHPAQNTLANQSQNDGQGTLLLPLLVATSPPHESWPRAGSPQHVKSSASYTIASSLPSR